MISWHLLTEDADYADLGGDHFQRRANPDRHRDHLIEQLHNLGYRVTLCDARPVCATARRFPAAEVVVDWPHRYLRAEIEAGRVDGRTVVCVLTHDPKFDVPLLESRFRLQRRVFRQTSRHLDMLHPGRRLWKARLESCSLQSLERGVMGFHREDDIPGAFIPERYFEYLRCKDGRLMVQVLEHNLQDIG